MLGEDRGVGYFEPALRRGSQRHRTPGLRMRRLEDRWISLMRVTHPLARAALRRQAPEVGAQCGGSFACWDLCGGGPISLSYGPFLPRSACVDVVTEAALRPSSKRRRHGHLQPASDGQARGCRGVAGEPAGRSRTGPNVRNRERQPLPQRTFALDTGPGS